MNRTWKRLAIFLLALPLVLFITAWAYKIGMAVFEHKERSLGSSLLWASETLTSVGYGGDNHWEHPTMIAMVLVTQFVGQFALFLIFPFVVIPFFENYFTRRLPRAITSQRDHILIYRHNPTVESFVAELKRRKVTFVVAEEDEVVARRLYEHGTPIVFLDEGAESVDFADLSRARAIVANGEDHESAVMITSAREAGFEGPIFTFVDHPSHRRPLMLSGASAAYTPKHILAAAVAAKASVKIAPRLQGTYSLGDALVVTECRVQAGSELAEQTIQNSHIRSRTGATILGIWGPDGLIPLPESSETIQAGSLLLAAGSEQAIHALGELATVLHRRGPFLLIGYGEVGQKTKQLLEDVGEEVIVIDRNESEGVDIVGDALEPLTLNQAGIQEAQAVILALDSGSPTLLATTLVRDLVPDVPIIARVNRRENVARIHKAGADFALSVGQVASQLLIQQLFGEQSISLERKLKVLRVSSADLIDESPLKSSRVHRHRSSVIAIERDEAIIVEFDDNFRIIESDSVFLCGDDEAIDSYLKSHPQS